MRKRRKVKRKYYSGSVINELIKLVQQDKSRTLTVTETIPKEIYLTNFDKITHLRKIDEKGDIMEVINVSYEIKLENDWITIVRYDSAHGHLHRHTLFSLDSPDELVDRDRVIKRGNPELWYTWAIEDIKERFLEYRKGFTKRSKILNLGY